MSLSPSVVCKRYGRGSRAALIFIYVRVTYHSSSCTQAAPSEELILVLEIYYDHYVCLFVFFFIAEYRLNTDF